MSDRLRQSLLRYNREIEDIDLLIGVHQDEIKKFEAKKADVTKARDAIASLVPKQEPKSAKTAGK